MIGNVVEGVGSIGGIKRREKKKSHMKSGVCLMQKKNIKGKKKENQNIYTPLQIMLAIVMRECAELDRLSVSEADSGARVVVVEEEASTFGCPIGTSRP